MSKKIHGDVTDPNAIVRKKYLPRYTGLQRTANDEMIKRGEFPQPITLTSGGRAKGWLLRDILEWQRKRLAARDQEEKE